jgi:hypothetical protein
VSAPRSLKADAAQLAGLLRREPYICVDCAAVKLTLTVERVRAAVDDLLKIVAFDQGLRTCPICGQERRVLSLAPSSSPDD